MTFKKKELTNFVSQFKIFQIFFQLNSIQFELRPREIMNLLTKEK